MIYTLNIVVEREVFVFVFSQEFERIVIPEIFELNQAFFGVLVCDCGHEFVDEFFVLFSRDAFLF